MINVNVLSEEQAWSKKIKKKQLFFKKICSFFPKKYQFSNKKGTKKLNKDFRNKNKSTDVLSFPFNKQTKISKVTYIGDIIISYNFMDKPKSQNLKNFKDKVTKTFIHGFLHLLGFDHVKDKDYKKMLNEEEKLYKSVISKIN